jgi:hypothetical protein
MTDNDKTIIDNSSATGKEDTNSKSTEQTDNLEENTNANKTDNKGPLKSAGIGAASGAVAGAAAGAFVSSESSDESENIEISEDLSVEEKMVRLIPYLQMRMEIIFMMPNFHELTIR